MPLFLDAVLYHFVLHAELESNIIMYGIVSIVSGLILAAAHSNVAGKLKLRYVQYGASQGAGGCLVLVELEA